MNVVAELYHAHRRLDEAVTSFERWLTEKRRVQPMIANRLVAHLFTELPSHIDVEETRFYGPLKLSHQVREALVERLIAEHDDLLQTLDHLQQLQRQRRLCNDEEFRAYGFHLIELYRDHTEREHRELFPLLEQLPHRQAGGQKPITKETTLNAIIKRFPTLLETLQLLQLDIRWYGSSTLEEVAWYQGVELEELLTTLNRAALPPLVSQSPESETGQLSTLGRVP